MYYVLCTSVSNSGGGYLEHLQLCSVCDPENIFFTSMFTHKTETGTANRWGTTNTKPLGPIYEWRKVVCFVLFCSYEIHQTGMLQIVFLVSLESCRWGGVVQGLGSMMFGVWTCCAKVLEYWMISSLKIKLNCSKILWRNWHVPLMLLERSWWGGYTGIYLVRFGFRMSEILIFKWFLLLNIQIGSKKPGFGRKNQLRAG